MANRDNQIIALSQDLAKARAAKEERAALVTELQPTVATREAELAGLSGRLSAQSKELEAHQRQVQQLVYEREEIFRSTSSQITAPLRSVKRTLLWLGRTPSLSRA